MGCGKGLCGRGCAEGAVEGGGDGLWGWGVGMGCEDGLWGGAVRMGCEDGLWEAAGAAATPAAFYLGLCRLRGSYPPPAATKTICYSLNDGAAGGPFQTAATRVMQ